MFTEMPAGKSQHQREMGNRSCQMRVVLDGKIRKQSISSFARRLKDEANSQYPGLIENTFMRGKQISTGTCLIGALAQENGYWQKTSPEAAGQGRISYRNHLFRCFAISGPGASKPRCRQNHWLVYAGTVAGIFVYLWISTGSWEEMKVRYLDGLAQAALGRAVLVLTAEIVGRPRYGSSGLMVKAGSSRCLTVTNRPWVICRVLARVLLLRSDYRQYPAYPRLYIPPFLGICIAALCRRSIHSGVAGK